LSGRTSAQRIYTSSHYGRPIWGVLADLPLMPSPKALRETEYDLLVTGEAAVRSFWHALGLAVERIDADTDYIRVCAPHR
jgi:hypothetical protein